MAAMRRSVSLVVSLLLITTACSTSRESSPSESLSGERTGTPSDTATTAPAVDTTTTAPAGKPDADDSHSSALEGTTTSIVDPATTTMPRPPPEGEPAPEFVLALGEDGVETFTLSEETKPVFLIVWAEW